MMILMLIFVFCAIAFAYAGNADMAGSQAKAVIEGIDGKRLDNYERVALVGAGFFHGIIAWRLLFAVVLFL